MRMLQLNAALNMENGAGYYVSSVDDETSMKYFCRNGDAIKLEILTRRDVGYSIDVITGFKETRNSLEQILREHLDELLAGSYLNWHLTSFEVYAECIILGYYRPVDETEASISLSARKLKMELEVPRRKNKFHKRAYNFAKRHKAWIWKGFLRILNDLNSVEKYTILQSNQDYGDEIRSYTEVTEQIDGVRRDFEFTYDRGEEASQAGDRVTDRYVTVTEYAG